MEQALDMCSGCPFNPRRDQPPIDDDVRRTIARRIRAGERWVCHQTCDGARITEASKFCAGHTATMRRAVGGKV